MRKKLINFTGDQNTIGVGEIAIDSNGKIHTKTSDLSKVVDFEDKVYIDDNITVVTSKINKNKITNGAFISLSEAVTGTTLDVVTGTTANEVSRGDHTHSYAASDSVGGPANSTRGALTIQKNGIAMGTTFNGSGATTINIPMNKNDVGLGNVENTADINKTVGAVAWSGVTGKPSNFQPSSHSHGIVDLSGVAASSHSHGIVDLSGVAASSHTHSDYVPKNGNTTIDGVLTVQDIAFSSDSRLKENIISYKEQPLNSLDAKYFTWKNGDNKRELGYIAQEVQAVYPEFVSEDNNGFLSINKGAIHTAKIAELEYQIELIRNELLKLQNKN